MKLLAPNTYKQVELWELPVTLIENMIRMHSTVRVYTKGQNTYTQRTYRRQFRRRMCAIKLLEREIRYRGYKEYRVWLASIREAKDGDVEFRFSDWLEEAASSYGEPGWFTMARRIRCKYAMHTL